MSPELQGLSSGLAAAAAIIVTTWLLRAARPVARQEGAQTVVEYGRTMKVAVIILWLVVVGIAVAAAFARPGDRVTAYCVAGGFFLAALALHLESFYVSIRYDQTGLHTASPWRRSRFIPWSAITVVEFSAGWQWYVLYTKGHGCVRLQLFLSGLQTLLEELEHRGYFIPPSPRLAGGRRGM
ncbi:MAG TPA: hypothetical protein VG796_30050 [Verrucomicrobiales bacterium]|jgi:hypothetical protein|nr:hypothetical protein [Verrucomicrobiales bacterium]